MDRIVTAADRLASAERRADVARLELHAAILEAHAEGMSLAVLARASGYSRERVRQIVLEGE